MSCRPVRGEDWVRCRCVLTGSRFRNPAVLRSFDSIYRSPGTDQPAQGRRRRDAAGVAFPSLDDGPSSVQHSTLSLCNAGRAGRSCPFSPVWSAVPRPARPLCSFIECHLGMVSSGPARHAEPMALSRIATFDCRCNSASIHHVPSLLCSCCRHSVSKFNRVKESCRPCRLSLVLSSFTLRLAAFRFAGYRAAEDTSDDLDSSGECGLGRAATVVHSCGSGSGSGIVKTFTHDPHIADRNALRLCPPESSSAG